MKKIILFILSVLIPTLVVFGIVELFEYYQINPITTSIVSMCVGFGLVFLTYTLMKRSWK